MVIGWREYVTLPDLGLKNIHAKVDTGALTTALHASHVKTYSKDGNPWVQFQPPRVGGKKPELCHAQIHDIRDIRNTSGVAVRRIIIRTTLKIAGRLWMIDLSLADRTRMAFPIIIGRSAIRRHHLLVDCGRSYLTDRTQAPCPMNPS